MKKANGHGFEALKLKIARFDNALETTDRQIEPTFNFIESRRIVALKVRAPTSTNALKNVTD